METAALNHSLNPCFYGKTCEVRSQGTGDTLTVPLPQEDSCQCRQAWGAPRLPQDVQALWARPGPAVTPSPIWAASGSGSASQRPEPGASRAPPAA